MAYASWSVVFGEQPSASKWNILGTNDASFADGTGIANLSQATTAVANPYKFSVYKTTGQTGMSTGTKITWNTELFDTNGNFASSTYTAPVAGFYMLHAQAYIASSTSFAAVDFYKNGSLYTPGDAQSSSNSGDVVCSNLALLQLSASDTIETYLRFGGGGTRTVFGVTDVAIGTTGPTRFEGILISRT